MNGEIETFHGPESAPNSRNPSISLNPGASKMWGARIGYAAMPTPPATMSRNEP